MPSKRKERRNEKVIYACKISNALPLFLCCVVCLFISPDHAVPLAPPHHPPLTVRRLSNDIGEVQLDAHLESFGNSIEIIRFCICLNLGLRKLADIGNINFSLHLFEQLKDEAGISDHVSLAVPENLVIIPLLLYFLQT